MSCINNYLWTPADEWGGLAVKRVLSKANGRDSAASGPLVKRKPISFLNYRTVIRGVQVPRTWPEKCHINMHAGFQRECPILKVDCSQILGQTIWSSQQIFYDLDLNSEWKTSFGALVTTEVVLIDVFFKKYWITDDV